MLKKVVFGVVLTVLIVGGLLWFFHTKEARMPVTEGINAIPSDAAIIFESKQAKSAWKKLSQTNIMWEELLGTTAIAKLNTIGIRIDSVLQTSSEISQLLDEHSIYISAHKTGKYDYDFLIVFSLPDLTYKAAVEEFFREKLNDKKLAPTEKEIEGEKITTITSVNNTKLHFSITNGILLISCTPELIENSIHQLKKGNSLSSNKNFNKIVTASGKNVDANVYINYKRFPELMSSQLFDPGNKTLSPLESFADFSGWDISLRPNALTLSGFTAASVTDNSFLSLFSKQKPQEMEMIKLIPSNSSAFLFMGLSDARTYNNDRKTYLTARQELNSYADYIQKVNAELHTDVEEAMFSWMDNELCVVITESDSLDKENTYAVIRSNNIDEATTTLNQLSDLAFEANASDEKDKNSPVTYKNHIINRLLLFDLLPHLLGDPFKNMNNSFYTAIDNYIVFANSQSELCNFIDAVENHKTLANDKNYKSFSENISAESNIYLYNSIARSQKLYSRFVKESLTKDLEANKEILKKFEASGIQFSSNGKLFYSNIYLKYNPEQKQESGTLWETKLDTTFSGRPYLLINHKTKAKEVFVQDDANKIYLISNTGKVLWSKRINEKIMSDVTQVDVLKNDKLQLIFNTRSFIYMFDRNGVDMPGFPIKLRSPATNAISVVDYEKNREYRIFIATENKRVVCYQANGEQLTAFAFDKTENQVFLPVQFFVANNKDHLCLVDVKGKIYLLDRKGNTRVNLKEGIEPGIRNFFVEPGKDYNKSYLIAADTLGNIVKMNLTGHKESIKLQVFETSPYFELKDINDDKTKEFIFLTRNELKVFSQDKSLLFKYEFPTKISHTPLFFLFPDGQGRIGVPSEETNELFLFNNNGSLYDGFPMNGRTAFSIGDLNNEGHYNLVTGSTEKSIFVYQLK